MHLHLASACTSKHDQNTGEEKDIKHDENQTNLNATVPKTKVNPYIIYTKLRREESTFTDFIQKRFAQIYIQSNCL